MCQQGKDIVCGCVNWWQVEPSGERTLLPIKKEEEKQQQTNRFYFPKGLFWTEYLSFTFLMMLV